jgi:hypothetical protein
MQQGACPVYPKGQLAEPPPKQRGTPEVSSRHVCSTPITLKPSQQLVSLLTVKIPPSAVRTSPPSSCTGLPQMVPAARHEVPLLHLRSLLQVTLLVTLPQQAASVGQKSPATRQPPTGWHTVAPVPRSAQTFEQQLVPLEQGTPA